MCVTKRGTEEITYHALALNGAQAGVQGIGAGVEVEQHDQNRNVPDEDNGEGREIRKEIDVLDACQGDANHQPDHANPQVAVDQDALGNASDTRDKGRDSVTGNN